MDGNPASRVSAVRRFNRFYTRRVGILGNGYLNSPFSLTQVRVLFELADRKEAAAADLCRDLGLDAGYLSRILRDFGRRGLVGRKPSERDGRQNLLWLTEEGRAAFEKLNARSSQEIASMLDPLSSEEQERLVGAMTTIEGLLGSAVQEKVPYVLRPHRPGDMGWVVQRHGVLYAREYGWDERFEALVATIVAHFIERYDPRRERCWIAERRGQPVGSVFLVRKTDRTAKLRLLLVEPEARGLGIATRLVEECIQFARSAGYRKIVLWTNSVLLAARHVYERAGFQLVAEEPHNSFGHDLVGETWELRP